MERVSFMVRMLLTVRKRSSPSSDGSDRSLATSASPPPPRASSGPDTLQQARAAPPDEAARADACRGGENCGQEWEGGGCKHFTSQQQWLCSSCCCFSCLANNGCRAPSAAAARTKGGTCSYFKVAEVQHSGSRCPDEQPVARAEAAGRHGVLVQSSAAGVSRGTRSVGGRC